MPSVCGKGPVGPAIVFSALILFAGDPAIAEENAGDIFARSVKIERAAQDVWAALVTKSIVDTYYVAPLSKDVTAAGQTIYYGSKDQQLITGKVLELTAPEVFKHSFKFAGEGEPESVVTYSLKPFGAGTELKVTHEGYARDSQSYADIAGGWPIILDNLKAKLEAN